MERASASSYPDHQPESTSSMINAMEFDLLDEFLLGGAWSDAPPADYSGGYFHLEGSPSASGAGFFPGSHGGVEESTCSMVDHEGAPQPPGSFRCLPAPSSSYDHRNQARGYAPQALHQSYHGTEATSTPPNALVPVSPPSPSVKDRLSKALTYIQESYRDSGHEVLIQIWVPVRLGHKQVLTTIDQPFSLDPTSQRLGCYRTVSVNYLFSAAQDGSGSGDDLGLPGRVFLGRLPEWTPDVRLFRRFEYPRLSYAQHYDVRGSVGIPVFERGGACLGVVEVVMTTKKINYSLEIANMCKALQAVDLRGGELPHIDRTLKDKCDFYHRALPEIAEVLRATCLTHTLPLGQAWMSCIQQGKKGSRHTSDNYRNCVSTIDDICFVNDPSVRSFHEACSDHHLFKGQGVAGKAFTSNKPCFSSDITGFQKTEYPLSHHAQVFNLHGAVAIRLWSTLASKIDFVLEFFLPFDCVDLVEQTSILNSMSITIQQVSWHLRAVTTKESQDDCVLTEIFCNDETFGEFDLTTGQETPTGVSQSMMSDTSLHCFVSNKETSLSEEKKIQEFSHESQWNKEGHFPMKNKSLNLSYNKELNGPDNKQNYNTGNPLRRAGKDRRNLKPEKAISLKVLQKYFAGSLKDAAKDLGVCPTTLKRICRQHGITRWPSRKIKKVGHSLKKLQKVIDSVQGIDKSFRFSSLCASIENPFGKDLVTHSASGFKDLSTLKLEDSSDPQGCLFDVHRSISKSASSSCSQNSTQSHNCSNTEKLICDASQVPVEEAITKFGDHISPIKSATNEVDLDLFSQASSVVLSDSRSVSMYPLVGIRWGMNSHIKNLIGVKASFGEDKVRFRFQPMWSLEDLRQEIVTRFNIDDPGIIELKYLDDDSEWVLLTCDADLQECIDVHQSSKTPIMKLFVNHTGQAGGS